MRFLLESSGQGSGEKVINEMTREEHLAQMEQIFAAIGQLEDFMKEFGGGEQQQDKSEEKAG